MSEEPTTVVWVVFVLTCEDGAVKFGIGGCLDEAHIGRQLVPRLDEQDVARHKMLGKHGNLVAVTNDLAAFREHGLDGCHDPRRRPVLPHVEAGLDEEHGEEDNGKREIGIRGGLSKRTPCDEDEN